MNETSLRILAAMRLINQSFGKPVEGKWIVAANLNRQAWDALRKTWCVVNDLNEKDSYKEWAKAWDLVAGAGYSKYGDVVYYE